MNTAHDSPRNPGSPLRIALTGATGYVGGRLAPRLLASGHQLNCLVRSRQKLESRHWSGDSNVSTFEVDMTDEDSMVESLRGCDVAYYLVHSMQSSRDYARQDDLLANNFARAAETAGVKRIIYLGGLGETGDGLSTHLTSRRQVESALESTSIPVTTLRAAMIIGSGSASFEILRYLVERLPIMVTPKWVSTESQPISVIDVLFYLEACLDSPDSIGRTIDVGGSSIITYRELMKIMAKALGLRKRFVIPVPLLTPRLSSYWIHFVTPVIARIAQPLAEGLSNRVVCRDDIARRMFKHEPLDPAEAIKRALQHETTNEVMTSWMDAGRVPGDPDWSGGKVFIDQRSTTVNADAQSIYEAIRIIGGGHGYYSADWLWHVRGFMDKALGGPGLRRGRRDQRELAFGDALDFWRVLHADPGRRLTLFAEMKLPGTATLEFDIKAPTAAGESPSLVQVARFRPRGLLGILYWYSIKPLHGIVFNGILNGIKREAEATSPSAESGAHTHA
ncbi:MAG: SDR family oxidoreductase [Phycisphaerales bacterium]|nr:SDR family oxidoreductase [Phycisphaerales bacterium]